MWLTVSSHRLFLVLNCYGLASFVSGSTEKGHNFLRTLYGEGDHYHHPSACDHTNNTEPAQQPGDRCMVRESNHQLSARDHTPSTEPAQQPGDRCMVRESNHQLSARDHTPSTEPAQQPGDRCMVRETITTSCQPVITPPAPSRHSSRETVYKGEREMRPCPRRPGAQQHNTETNNTGPDHTTPRESQRVREIEAERDGQRARRVRETDRERQRDRGGTGAAEAGARSGLPCQPKYSPSPPTDRGQTGRRQRRRPATAAPPPPPTPTMPGSNQVER